MDSEETRESIQREISQLKYILGCVQRYHNDKEYEQEIRNKIQDLEKQLIVFDVEG